jgi:probable HAF family extracellular repeat protein
LDLGTLGGPESVALGIDAASEVVGWSENANYDTRAFVYSDSTMKDLGTLGGTYSAAFGSNPAGHVVGFSALAGTSYYHAFLYSNGMMTNLGTLGGELSAAYAINSAGQVAGYSSTTGLLTNHAFLWEDGTMTDLGTLPDGQESQAFALNDAGQVVGASQFARGNDFYHAFSWDRVTGMHDLGTLGGNWSRAWGLNAAGQVVGGAAAPDGYQHAFLYSGGSMRDLGTLGYAISYATSINLFGQVVGILFSGASRPFLYSDGEMTDLNDLLPPGSGWTLEEARGINDAGLIVGWGFHFGQKHAYLLKLGPPSTSPGMASALVGATLDLSAQPMASGGTVPRAAQPEGIIAPPIPAISAFLPVTSLRPDASALDPVGVDRCFTTISHGGCAPVWSEPKLDAGLFGMALLWTGETRADRAE